MVDGSKGSGENLEASRCARLSLGGLILASPNLSAPTWLAGAGWVLLVTSALMLLVPWKLHRSFARIAVPRAPFVLQGMGLASVCAGAFLLWALAV